MCSKKLDITIVFEEPLESSAEGGGPFIPIVQHIELLTVGSHLFSETRWTSDAYIGVLVFVDASYDSHQVSLLKQLVA